MRFTSIAKFIFIKKPSKMFYSSVFEKCHWVEIQSTILRGPKICFKELRERGWIKYSDICSSVSSILIARALTYFFFGFEDLYLSRLGIIEFIEEKC